MALSDLFFVTQDLDSYFVDPSTGLPLAGGQIYFYRDVARTELKPVFTLDGIPPYSNASYVQLPNPITLSAVGTVQDESNDNVAIYYYPWLPPFPDTSDPVLDLYYVVVTDSAGTVVLTREAWPPQAAAGESPILQGDNFTTNQISNPQFTNTFINAGIATMYTVMAATMQVFQFGPDWFFQISGTGTVTVQIFPIAGSQNIPTSPPYVLDVNVSSGITLCYLTQRFYNNSGLWTSTSSTAQIFLYGSFLAENILSGTGGIQMLYVESTPSFTPIVIVDGMFTSPYMLVTGSTATAIPSSNNPATGQMAYVDIDLAFQPNSHVRISSIQLIPSAIAPVNIILPDFDSSNRNEAYQGDWYIPRAAAKQIDSFLVGWDFCVSPYQFGSSGTVTTTPMYIADQTIAVGTSSVAWNVDPITNGLQFNTSTTNGAFALIQYLDGDQVLDMIGNSLSANVFAYQSSGTASPIMRVYLYRASTGNAAIPTLPAIIGTVATDGTFALIVGNNWSAVSRNGLPSFGQATLNTVVDPSSIVNPYYDYGFSEWMLAGPEATTTSLFACVVTFAYVNTSTIITVNSISVTPGDLPSRPAIKSFDETLRKCQYYFEKSYDPATVPGTVTPIGCVANSQPGTVAVSGTSVLMTIYPANLYLQYKQQKRVIAPPAFYSILGVSGSVSLAVFYGYRGPVPPNDPQVYEADVVFSSGWSLVPVSVPSIAGGNPVNTSTSGFILEPLNRRNTILMTTYTAPYAVVAYDFPEIIVAYHYVIDARLGVI